jgi:hypothetical protein
VELICAGGSRGSVAFSAGFAPLGPMALDPTISGLYLSPVERTADCESASDFRPTQGAYISG